jgi:hypothetical protein
LHERVVRIFYDALHIGNGDDGIFVEHAVANILREYRLKLLVGQFAPERVFAQATWEEVWHHPGASCPVAWPRQANDLSLDALAKPAFSR